MADTDTKQHAHELIDRMAPSQVAAVVGVLEVMLDPVARRIANASYEDEPISEDEERAVAESKAWLAAHPGQTISHSEMLTEFGRTAEDLKGD